MAHPLEVQSGPIGGLLMIRPRQFRDDRGVFAETWRHAHFEEAVGHSVRFVQDNESVSGLGVLRGLHFQVPERAQGKLVRVVQGSALDVAVDLRKSSPTYGQHQTAMLSGENRWQFWVPPGFAHGIVTLEPNTIFCYKCTDIYSPKHERSLLWNDPALGIHWGVPNPLLSSKDAQAPLLVDFDSPYE